MQTDIVPFTDPEQPEPPVRKPSRKKRKELAEAAAGDMGLLQCSPEMLQKISSLGLHVEDVGPGQIAKGMLCISYDEAVRALEDADKQIKKIDDLEVQTPEDKDRRLLWARFKLEYTSLKVKLADSIDKTKQVVTKEVVRQTSVPSFPANTPIPPMSVTETVSVKQTG